jgi:hypothetical protein
MKELNQFEGDFTIPDMAFPDSIHHPTSAAQCGINMFVPCPNSSNFVFPQFLMALGFCIPAIVAVPKTTVRKHDDPFIGENEVGFSELDIISLPCDDLSLCLARWSKSYYWEPLPMKGMGNA